MWRADSAIEASISIAAIEVYALQGPPPDTFPPSMPGGLAVTVREPAQVPRAFQQAFHLMRSGRPGPVLIALGVALVSWGYRLLLTLGV